MCAVLRITVALPVRALNLKDLRDTTTLPSTLMYKIDKSWGVCS